MTDRERHAETDLLSRCLFQDKTGELQQHEQRLFRAESDERCLRRAMLIMGILLALAFTGAGHAAVVLKDATPHTLRLTIYAFSVISVASVISLVWFGLLWLIRRDQIGKRREDCRRATVRVLSGQLPNALTPAPQAAPGPNPAP